MARPKSWEQSQSSKSSERPAASAQRSGRSRQRRTETLDSAQPTAEPVALDAAADTLRELVAPEAAAPSQESTGAAIRGIAGWALETQEVTLRAIDTRGGNVRKTMDPGDLSALQASLARYGMLEPVLLQPIPGKRQGHRYRLIAGFRRVTAAKALGWDTVPARVIARELSADDVVAVQLTENLQREGMRVRDIVTAIATLRDAGHSMRAIAEQLGMGESTVRLYAQVGDLLAKYPRLWPHFDRGLISIEQFRAAARLIRKARERAGTVTSDPAEQERIVAQAETVFVAMLERLAKIQPLTVKRVAAEVARLLQRAGLEAPEESEGAVTEAAAARSLPALAIVTNYERLDVTALDAPALERLILASERQLAAARARLDRLAQAGA